MEKLGDTLSSFGFWILLALAAFVVAMLILVGKSTEMLNNFSYIIAVICLFTSIAAFLMLLLFYATSLNLNMEGVSVGALGLPEGSVRAFLAIGLLSLVAVFGTFIYFEAGRPTNGTRLGEQIYTVEADAVEAQKHAPANVLALREGGDNKTFKIAYFTVVDQSGRNDLAKQILTMIMTLLTTVVGFYFGSRSAEGQKEGGGVPLAETARRDELVALRSEMTGVSADLKKRLETVRTAVNELNPEGDKATAVGAVKAKLAALPSTVSTALDTLTNAATTEIASDDKGVAKEMAKLRQARTDAEKAIGDLEAALRVAQ